MQKEFDMTPYGKPGEKIILDEPDAERTIAFQNALFKYCMTSEEKASFRALQKDEQDRFFNDIIMDNMGTALALIVLKHIVSAPFINPKDSRLDLKAFLNYLGTDKAYNDLFKFANENFDLKGNL